MKNKKVLILSIIINLMTYIKSEVKIPEKALIDIHAHADGSITVEMMKKLMEIKGEEINKTDEEILNFISVDENCTSLIQFLEKFDNILPYLQSEEAIEYIFQAVPDNMESQGVIYAELKFAPQQHTENMTQRQAVEAALRGIRKSKLDSNIILCMMRGNNTHLKNMETIEIANEIISNDKIKNVVAIDLVGDEYNYPNGELFKNEIKKINEYNLPMTIHGGEIQNYDFSVKAAIDYGTFRVGHGVNSYLNETLVDEIISKNVTLEFCPTSNKITQAVPSMDLYPIESFLEKGVLVTLNTDDMGICRTTLKEEFEYIIANYKISQDNIYKMIYNSIDASFTNEIKKQELRKKLEEEIERIESESNEELNSEELNSTELSSEELNSEELSSEELNSEELNSEELNSTELSSEENNNTSTSYEYVAGVVIGILVIGCGIALAIILYRRNCQDEDFDRDLDLIGEVGVLDEEEFDALNNKSKSDEKLEEMELEKL